MSHNYPYRPPPSDSDLRSDPGPYGSSDRRHASSSSSSDFYTQPLESDMPLSPSSRGSFWSQDGGLSILSSCGLEPADLALLAELPEDVLTVESLPQVLKQIKGKRGTIKRLNTPSSSSSSSSYPPRSSTTSNWDPPHNQPVQYPLSHLTLGPLLPELDRWGNPIPFSSPSSSVSSSFVVDFKPGPSGKTGVDVGPFSPPDYNSGLSEFGKKVSGPVVSQDYIYRPGPSDYGKTFRDAGPVSSQDYNYNSRPSDLGKTGRDAGPVSYRDYNYRPSDLGKTGRDAGPVSYRDYNYRPSDLGKTGSDAGPVSSLDYNSRTSDYVQASRDACPLSSLDYKHESEPSDYGKTGRYTSPVSSLDYNHGTAPPDFGKKGTVAGPVSSQVRPSFGPTGRGEKIRPSRFSQPTDHGSIPPPEEQLLNRGSGHGGPEVYSSSTMIPAKEKAQDFHGTSPLSFPYSCSLCDITVMSEKVWIKHINGPHHANGQLSLLQQFPHWDCRMESVSSADSQSKKNDEGKPARQQKANQKSSDPQPKKAPQKKVSDKCKVVCVKFPAQSVDESYLRKLTKPFGKIVKILMFPSLAFVELGSADQARDLVKHHDNFPPTLNGATIEFRLSNTFNFLQSSRVVSFSPAPSGEDSQSDLLSIVKRFGEPIYTLFLPSKAYVEMKDTLEAQKLVDFYSSKALKINTDSITVSFSGEFKTLASVTAATSYEDTVSRKRTRRTSREEEDKMAETKRKRRSSKDQDEERSSSTDTNPKEDRTKSRSRETSRDKNTKDKSPREKSRSREKSIRSKSTRTRSRSRGRSISEKRCRSKSRSRSRDKSREKSTRERRSRSRSKDKSTSGSSEKNQTEPKSEELEELEEPEKLEKPETTGTYDQSKA
ncbi:hypothetical protein PBY51_015551 [Eleginops maclovinus]|uniref:RRM domain-containing protein n=1 Tax=Eleginops maclovinus TaxID=56733 RepID=A0AAN8APZ4_ELEMC|nr:hypothetical protein PBY51_015551 [Eleginops maclovinus]